MSICLITGDVNLGRLDTVVSANFFHCKVTVFPFAIDKYLWVGRCFVVRGYPASLQTFEASTHAACLYSLLLQHLTNGDFLVPSLL